MEFSHRPHTLNAARALGFGFFLCLVIFLIPFAFLMEQNYALFQKMAMHFKPELINYLEREILWLRVFLGLAGTTTVLALTMIALRMLKLIAAPMTLVERHWKEWQRSPNWSQEFPSRPDTEELDQSFFANYKAFQQHLLKELNEDHRILQQIEFSELSRKNRSLIESLIQRSHRRSGRPFLAPDSNPGTNDSSASSSEVAPLRRVS